MKILSTVYQCNISTSVVQCSQFHESSIEKKKKIHELCHPWRHHLINYEANIFHMNEVTVS